MNRLTGDVSLSWLVKADRKTVIDSRSSLPSGGEYLSKELLRSLDCGVFVELLVWQEGYPEDAGPHFGGYMESGQLLSKQKARPLQIVGEDGAILFPRRPDAVMRNITFGGLCLSFRLFVELLVSDRSEFAEEKVVSVRPHPRMPRWRYIGMQRTSLTT
jgi:hypothetical protein